MIELIETRHYCVIDISKDVDEAFPIQWLSDAPEYGWTDEYKTEKIVLRRIDPGQFDMTEESCCWLEQAGMT